MKVQKQMRRMKIRRFADLARRIGVSPQAVSRWFNGSPFSPDSLGALVRVLDCTPNDVLDWEDAQPSPAQPSEAVRP